MDGDLCGCCVEAGCTLDIDHECLSPDAYGGDFEAQQWESIGTAYPDALPCVPLDKTLCAPSVWYRWQYVCLCLDYLEWFTMGEHRSQRVRQSILDRAVYPCTDTKAGQC